jgi:GT2 family glycosyltransferase
MHKSTNQPVVVIPNLNGGQELLAAVQSLVEQSLQPHIIVVDNASIDGSAEAVAQKYPAVEIIRNKRNLGYAGGVNPGFKRAIERGAAFVAPFNDDATADKHWLKRLVDCLESNPKTAAAACKVITSDKQRLDSTGDYYTNWGLPYPRGRREYDLHKYDADIQIFAASGAASLYRLSALQKIGMLDEDFFAYYEDVDLSFRLQLAGWNVRFVPDSIVYHHIGMTSGRIKGFTTYQTMKNLPLLWIKNVPTPYLWHVGWRLALAQTWPAAKGTLAAAYLLCKKLPTRHRIQKSKKVSNEYIWKLLVHDLPPNAAALRNLRAQWWRLRGKGE